jgi:hypothetical protein
MTVLPEPDGIYCSDCDQWIIHQRILEDEDHCECWRNNWACDCPCHDKDETVG